MNEDISKDKLIKELKDILKRLSDIINENDLRTKGLDFAIKSASGTLFENQEGINLIVSAAEKFLDFLKSSQHQI